MIRFIFLFIFSTSVFANFIPEDLVGTRPPEIFMKLDTCEKHYSKKCVSIPTGYNRHFHKIDPAAKKVVIDSVLKADYEAKKTESLKTEKDIKAQRRAQICGSRVVAVFSSGLNKKGLTNQQDLQSLSLIENAKNFLDMGLLTKARTELLNIPNNTTIFTEMDRWKLVDTLDKCTQATGSGAEP